jgi:hypothetical protein
MTSSVGIAEGGRSDRRAESMKLLAALGSCAASLPIQVLIRRWTGALHRADEIGGKEILEYVTALSYCDRLRPQRRDRDSRRTRGR